MEANNFNDINFRNAILNRSEYELKPYKAAAESIARNRFKNACSEDIAYCVNEALFDLFLHLDSFDPEEGAFTTFFNCVVGNRISEVREELKPASLRSIDRKLKETGGLSGEVRPVEVRIDLNPLFEAMVSDIPDEEAYSRLTSRRQHLEDGIEAFRKYVDTELNFSEQKMMYSSLGKVLDPAAYADTKKQGYAKEIALRTGQTAECIKQIVSRRKKEAVLYAQRQGYNSQSLKGFTYLLTKRPKDLEEFKLDAYSPFELFMMFSRVYGLLYEKIQASDRFWSTGDLKALLRRKNLE